ncbi:MAG: hypothetical protein QOD93_3893 [Acetobacteraceae bacterium]|jgi:hypothetical protein|nr:hypothetical protein [Acetobacteraceae bacterium]
MIADATAGGPETTASRPGVGVEPGLIFFRARPGARKAGVSPRVASCDDVAAAAGAFLV